MSERDDGGSAFPEIRTDTVGDHGEYRTEVYSVGGMTLLDFFAAKAMQAMLSNDKPISIDPHLFANEAGICYMVADAMMKERAK